MENIRNCDREISEKQESLDVMWESIKSIQSSHSDREMVVGGEKVTFDDRMARYIDYSREIDSNIDKLVDQKMEVIRLIEQLEDESHRTVLTARYVNTKGWKEIAELMGYDGKYIHEKNSEAVIAFSKVLTLSGII